MSTCPFKIVDEQHFVGGTDLQEEDVWRWESDGTIFSRHSTFEAGTTAPELTWYSGEPNNLDTEQCLELYPSVHGNTLNDIACSAEKRYICEHKGIIPLRQPYPLISLINREILFGNMSD